MDLYFGRGFAWGVCSDMVLLCRCFVPLACADGSCLSACFWCWIFMLSCLFIKLSNFDGLRWLIDLCFFYIPFDLVAINFWIYYFGGFDSRFLSWLGPDQGFFLIGDLCLVFDWVSFINLAFDDFYFWSDRICNVLGCMWK